MKKIYFSFFNKNHDFTDWRNFISKLTHLLFDIYDVIKVVVNDESPEGYLPTNENDVVEDHHENTGCYSQKNV